MPSRDLREAAFLIVRRKAAASLILPALFAGFGALLGYLWIKDSFALALKAFMLLFPYLFLFLSQDMFRDEIDSGALENVIFVNGGFRDYLLSKILILALVGLAASLAVFAGFAACGLGSGFERITSGQLAQLLAGALAGLYYLAVGGYLSFFFKAGSNVLVVIIGQVFLAIAFFLSMTARHGWVEAILSNTFPDFVSRLRFLGLALVFPNAVIVRRHPIFIGGLAVAALVVFYLEWGKIRKLELYRR
jgi:hypothetical protein